MTATIQEMSSAIRMTMNSEKQYCPTPLRAKPMGRNPSAVTRVPVSMEKATEV